MASAKENQEAVNAILPTYLLDDFIDWIAKHLDPEDVFTEERLSEWAVDNGYVKAKN